MRKADLIPRHAEMMCAAERLEYNFVTKRAVVYLPTDNCTDMTGTVAAVLRIDPAAREIVTVSDDLPDVAYVRVGEEWHAVRPRPFVWRPAEMVVSGNNLVWDPP